MSPCNRKEGRRTCVHFADLSADELHVFAQHVGQVLFPDATTQQTGVQLADMVSILYLPPASLLACKKPPYYCEKSQSQTFSFSATLNTLNCKVTIIGLHTFRKLNTLSSSMVAVIILTLVRDGSEVHHDSYMWYQHAPTEKLNPHWLQTLLDYNKALKLAFSCIVILNEGQGNSVWHIVILHSWSDCKYKHTMFDNSWVTKPRHCHSFLVQNHHGGVIFLA